MTQPKRLSLPELNRRLIDEIGVENYARTIITGPGLKVWHGSPRTLRAGSIYGEEGSSFSLILEGPKIGRWAEFDPAGSGGAEGGDLIDLTAAVYRCSIADAAKKAREHLAGRGDAAPAAPARKESAQTRDPARNQNIAKKIWMARQPIAGTPAETYLASRGLVAPPGAPLGFVRALKYPGKARRYFPALIAGFEQPSGEVAGILRIFLAPDGRGKAPVDEPKLMLGACGGCAVRLGPPAPTICGFRRPGERTRLYGAASAARWRGLPGQRAALRRLQRSCRRSCARWCFLASEHQTASPTERTPTTSARRLSAYAPLGKSAGSNTRTRAKTITTSC